MYQGSPLPLHFPKSVEKGERSEREGQCWPTGARSPTNQHLSWMATLSAMPHAGSSRRTRAHESSWSWRCSPHPSHTSHHLPLAQLPQLHSAIQSWASTFFPLTCFLSQLFSQTHCRLAPVTQSFASQLSPPPQYFLPHLVHAGPPNLPLLPGSLVTLRHSEVGLDSSQCHLVFFQGVLSPWL